jgi:hypothetical protein
MLVSSVLLLALLHSLGVTAMPSLNPQSAPVRRAQVTSLTTVTPSQLAGFAPYTEFARAAYCPPSIVQGWQCGGRIFFIFIGWVPWLLMALPRGLPSCPRIPGIAHRW